MWTRHKEDNRDKHDGHQSTISPSFDRFWSKRPGKIIHQDMGSVSHPGAKGSIKSLALEIGHDVKVLYTLDALVILTQHPEL